MLFHLNISYLIFFLTYIIVSDFVFLWVSFMDVWVYMCFFMLFLFVFICLFFCVEKKKA